MPTPPLHSARESRTRDSGPFTFRDLAHPAGQRIARHHHAPAQVCVVIDGGLLEVHSAGSAELSREGVVFRSPGAAHANVFSPAGARCLVLEIDAGWLSRMAEGLALPEGVRPSVPQISAVLARGLVREWAFRDDLTPTAIEALLVWLLDGLDRPGPERVGDPPPWLERVEEVVRARAMEGVTLRELADEADVHPVSVIRGFKRHRGCTPVELARTLRLAGAARALVDGDEPLSSVAVRCGFYDQSHLTNELGRRMRITPRRLRAARRAS